jgi:hypothetical protein
MYKAQKYIKKCYDLLFGGVICNFDKNLDASIYHFTNETLDDIQNVTNPTTEKLITYEKISSTDKVSSIFDQAINECERKNVLIVINSISLSGITEAINDYLVNIEINNNHTLQNITIINYTNDNTQVIYLIYDSDNNEIFKKTVNVFSSKGTLLSNDTNFFSETPMNRGVQKTVDTDKKSIYKVTQRAGKIKNVTMRWMNTISKSNKLIDQWWFNWYFNVPPCAHVRLSQSSGSCWLNSSINALFLIEPISNLIIKRYDELENKNLYTLQFEEFECKNCDLKVLLFSLVYNLVIRKKKANPNDKNFIGFLASKIKCEYENKKNKNLCNEVEYGDGGDSFEAIKIILKYILNSGDYLSIDILQEISKNYNDFVESYNTLVKKYNNTNKLLQDAINKYNKTRNKDLMIEYKRYEIELINIDKDIDYFKSMLKEKEKDLNQYNKTLQKPNDYSIDNNDMFKGMGTPDILVFRNNFLTLQRTITFDGTTYNLCSAVIKLNVSHVICGIICNNKAYIYDSNNILIETDWDKGEYGKYLTDQQTQDLYRNKKLNIKEIECAVYVRS